MRRTLVLAVGLAITFAVSGCGQPAATAGNDKPSAPVPVARDTAGAAPAPSLPTATATALSSADDFGDMSTWVAAPGSFGPIGAAAPIKDLLAHGYLVAERQDPCPVEHILASPALKARGVSFNDGTSDEDRIHGIWYSKKVKTAKGIHIGSTAKDLARAYGSALIDTPWRWDEGGADTRAEVLFDGHGGALVFLPESDGSVAGMLSAAGTSLDDVDIRMGGGC